jgi:hypothetical protein
MTYDTAQYMQKLKQRAAGSRTPFQCVKVIYLSNKCDDSLISLSR